MIDYNFAPGMLHKMRDETGMGLMECQRKLKRDHLEKMLEKPQTNAQLQEIVLEIFKVFTDK